MQSNSLLFRFTTAVVLATTTLLLNLTNRIEGMNPYVRTRIFIANRDYFSSNWSEPMFFGSAVLLSLMGFLSGRRAVGTLVLSLGVIWVFVESSLFIIFRDLGVDSFLETKDFDWREAAFWMESLKISLAHFFNEIFLFGLLRKILAWSTIGLVALFTLEMVRRRMRLSRLSAMKTMVLACSISLLLAVVLRFESIGRLWLKNSESMRNLWSNFSGPIPPTKTEGRRLTIVAYIGESTTAMNMGIYNSPEDNMPALSEMKRNDTGLLQFESIYATHSHTSYSLLEAFSLQARAGEDLQFILGRHRVSLVDLLKANGINTTLLNNQGATGSFNLTSSVIFRNVEKRVNSSNTSLSGNSLINIKRPFDHDFFETELTPIIGSADSSSRLIALHSYSGHFPYTLDIPDSFMSKADPGFSRLSYRAMAGDAPFSERNAIGYHKSISYIDFSVARTIDKLRGQEHPSILVYFSDHGESIFTDRMHDSHRFAHEMLRIPFLIYFNEAARKIYPELYRKYRGLAANGHTATLAQLPSTILDLFGIRLLDGENADKSATAVIGESGKLPPVLVRETSDGITYVDLNAVPMKPSPSNRGMKELNRTDRTTRIHALSGARGGAATRICYHRSNTYAKALRGSLVCDCLEADLMVLREGSLAVTHPPMPDVGFRLGEVFRIASKNRMSVWIDGKNIDRPQHAERLLRFLKDSIDDAKGHLVEFPSHSHVRSDSLKRVTDEMRRLGLATSYYVPTKLAQKCLAAIESGIPAGKDSTCRLVEADLAKALQSGMFSDYSFDFDCIRLMERLPFTDRLRWNTWNIPPDSVLKLRPNRFRMVIISNDDPNTL